MAERRMFSKTIIDSDAFVEMPISTRLLYYDLSMRADDDGFVNSPKKIMNFIGASKEDLNTLIDLKYIIPFESGVVVIRHWRIHNYIRSDRYKPTVYEEEKALLIKEKSGIYNLGIPNDNQAVDNWSTQDRLGKDRLGKGNKCSAPQNTKPTRHKYGEYQNVLLSDEELEKLKDEFSDDWQSRIENLSEYMASSGKSYKNHLATIRKWAKAETEKQTNNPSVKSNKGKFNNYNDTNKADYSGFGDKLLNEMLNE